MLEHHEQVSLETLGQVKERRSLLPTKPFWDPSLNPKMGIRVYG